MRNNNRTEVITRQDIVNELDELLDHNADDDKTLEEIGELQNSLHSIDIAKEREYLSLKESWDILEKEKSRKESIKLE